MLHWLRNTLIALLIIAVLFVLAFFQCWEFFGVFTSLLAMGALLIFSIWGYFRVRKKMAHAKFLVEAIFIGGAIAFSIVIKMIVFCVLEQTNDFISGFNSCISAVYSAIGGLTFEGLQDFELEGPVNRLMQSLYFFSSLFAGAMTLLIISAKASYEFYSVISLVLGKEDNKNIYVITAVTEETIFLAKDINQNDRDAVIVFASPLMQPFDGQDELCRQVMANGFLYWSYAKNRNRNKRTNKRKTKSIAKVLFLNNKNGGEFTKRNYSRRFVVYAFASEDHIPLEEENLDLVFDDIYARIETPDNLRVEYFLLTKREINFQAYNYRNREMMLEYAEAKQLEQLEETADGTTNLLNYGPFREYFITQNAKGGLPKSWKKFATKIIKEYSKSFVLNIWCEALTIGRQTIRTMMENGFDKYLATNDSGLRVWTLGFGTTGQAITNELFIQSAGVDENGATRDYMLDAFDRDALELGGMFKTHHTTYCYLYDDLIDSTEYWGDLVETLKKWRHSSIGEGLSREQFELCLKYLTSTALPLYFRNLQASSQHLHKEMPMPIYRLHGVSCLEMEFFNRIDKVTGSEANAQKTKETVEMVLDMLSKTNAEEVGLSSDLLDLLRKVFEEGVSSKMPEPPQVIVISTGDDYRNIRIANAIIQDIASENCESETCMQYIVVNVWDKHNNPLIINSDGMWNEAHDILISKNLTVIVVGNNDKVYTYGSTVKQDVEERYNFTYNGMCDWLYNPILKSTPQCAKNASEQAVKLADIVSKLLKHPDGGVSVSPEEVSDSAGFLVDCKSYVELLHKILCQHNTAEVDENSFAGEMFQKLFNGEVQLPAESYAALDIWSRESNKSAALFAPVLRQIYLACEGGGSAEEIIKLYSRISVTEHCRWTRMYIANGWIYNKKRQNSLRHHNCIIPFEQLDDDVILYDTLNGFWAIVSLQDKK